MFSVAALLFSLLVRDVFIVIGRIENPRQSDSQLLSAIFMVNQLQYRITNLVDEHRSLL